MNQMDSMWQRIHLQARKRPGVFVPIADCMVRVFKRKRSAVSPSDCERTVRCALHLLFAVKHKKATSAFHYGATNKVLCSNSSDHPCVQNNSFTKSIDIIYGKHASILDLKPELTSSAPTTVMFIRKATAL